MRLLMLRCLTSKSHLRDSTVSQSMLEQSLLSGDPVQMLSMVLMVVLISFLTARLHCMLLQQALVPEITLETFVLPGTLDSITELESD